MIIQAETCFEFTKSIMMLLFAFTRIVMLGFVGGVGGGFGGVGESSNGGDEISVESEVRGVVMVLMLLLVKGLTAAIFALSNTSVLSVKGLTTTVEFFSGAMGVTFR